MESKVTSETRYKCGHCGKKYKTGTDAEACYKNDTMCVCEKQDIFLLTSNITGHDCYGDAWFKKALINFADAMIIEQTFCGDILHETKEVCKIKVCPFCNRVLSAKK